MRRFRSPLLFILPLSIAIGAWWGLRLYRVRELAAQGRLRPKAEIKILAYKGLLSHELLARFEKATRIRPIVTEVQTPEELRDRLEPQKNANDPRFEIVSLFSYQVPLAMQMAKVQPMDPHRVLGLEQLAADFRDLPGDRSFQTVVPLLWGLTGIFYDSKKFHEPPKSWADLVRDAKSKRKLLWPASTAELARIANVPTDGKDLKPILQPWLASVSFAPDFLSVAGALRGNEESWVAALVSHGETAFPPLSALSGWKFTVPDDRAGLWTLALTLGRDASQLDACYAFLSFLTERDSAMDLMRNYRQASTNRLLESTDIDQRLKPSYLRQVPLTKVTLWKDFSRAREIRELVPVAPAAKSAEPAGGLIPHESR